MIHNPLISIIVPVYNAGKLLIDCIESLLAQSYLNFEICLVDDGSTDGSGRCCDQYAEKDSRIRVVHQENGGVSSARNLGLQISKGEFIAFVDADDRVRADYLEVIYRNIIEHNTDGAFCGHAQVDEDGNLISEFRIRSNERISISNPNELLNYGLTIVCAGMFSRDSLQGVLFPNLSYGEDTWFMFDWGCKKPTVSFVPYVGYLRVMHENSATANQTAYVLMKKNHLRFQEYCFMCLSKVYPETRGDFFDSICKNYSRYCVCFGSIRKACTA